MTRNRRASQRLSAPGHQVAAQIVRQTSLEPGLETLRLVEIEPWVQSPTTRLVTAELAHQRLDGPLHVVTHIDVHRASARSLCLTKHRCTVHTAAQK